MATLPLVRGLVGALGAPLVDGAGQDQAVFLATELQPGLTSLQREHNLLWASQRRSPTIPRPLSSLAPPESWVNSLCFPTIHHEGQSGEVTSLSPKG